MARSILLCNGDQMVVTAGWAAVPRGGMCCDRMQSGLEERAHRLRATALQQPPPPAIVTRSVPLPQSSPERGCCRHCHPGVQGKEEATQERATSPSPSSTKKSLCDLGQVT